LLSDECALLNAQLSSNANPMPPAQIKSSNRHRAAERRCGLDDHLSGCDFRASVDALAGRDRADFDGDRVAYLRAVGNARSRPVRRQSHVISRFVIELVLSRK
jgi:hypothetical protein